MSTRAIAAAGSFAGLLILVLVLEAAFASAGSALERDPCGPDGAPRPPTPDVFDAIRSLDRFAWVPWMKGRALDRAVDGADACLQAYGSACDTHRDDAVDAARDAVGSRIRGEGSGVGVAESATNWRAHLDEDAVEDFCASWYEWRRWLRESGLDAASACPVCVPAVDS